MSPEELAAFTGKLRAIQAKMRVAGYEWNARVLGYTIKFLEYDMGGYWDLLRRGEIK